MSTVVLYRESVTIPLWVKNLASFRRWAHSEEFPDTGRICYLDGSVWVDMSKEQLFSHNQVKGEYSRVLSTLVLEEQEGRFFPDGVLLTNIAADLSTQPDGTYVLHRSILSGRIRLIEGKGDGFVELQGSADMVLEVVSDSSEEKDLEILHQQYWEAQVREYWVVDARREPLVFMIHRRGPRGFVAVRKHDGWLKSAVFGKSFRLLRQQDALGNPLFRLEVR
jgi:Uma2 family endonuclease